MIKSTLIVGVAWCRFIVLGCSSVLANPLFNLLPIHRHIRRGTSNTLGNRNRLQPCSWLGPRHRGPPSFSSKKIPPEVWQQCTLSFLSPSLPSFPTVHLCVCVRGRGGVHVQAGGQPGASFLRCQSFNFFLEKGLSLTWNSPSRLGWLARKPQGSVYPCLPGNGITSTCHHTWLSIYI